MPNSFSAAQQTPREGPSTVTRIAPLAFLILVGAVSACSSGRTDAQRTDSAAAAAAPAAAPAAPVTDSAARTAGAAGSPGQPGNMAGEERGMEGRDPQMKQHEMQMRDSMRTRGRPPM